MENKKHEIGSQLVMWCVVFMLHLFYRRFTYQQNIFIIIIAWPITVGAFFGVHCIALRTNYIQHFIQFISRRFFLSVFEKKELPLRAYKRLSCLKLFFSSWQETGRFYVIHVRHFEMQHIMKITSDDEEKTDALQRTKNLT